MAAPVEHDRLKRIEGLSVVIQAGGESKRMGRSKALVPFLGEPLIWRTVRRLSPIASEMIVTTNEPERLSFLQDSCNGEKVRLVRDELSVRGALNGLYTALKNASMPYVAVIACDMVFASAPLAAYEYALLEEDGSVDAAIPKTSHGFEPFHAVYRRLTCLPLVEDAIRAGEHKAQSWYGNARLRLIDRREVLIADPRGGAFVNVNTPDELEQMERRISGGEVPYLNDTSEG